jgi:sporulation protein YlmC with PRC-barrel domain
MALIARTVILLSALAFSAGAWAADKDAAAGATKEVIKDRATWLDMRASELLGKEVANLDGKALGKIEELIVDLKGGGIPHVVLSFGPFGGVAHLGEKLFVFPVNAFERDEYRDRIVVDVERDQLRESRGFDRDKWPFDAPLQRASELRGKNINDSAGNPAGEIEDLVVNLGSGRVKDVVFAQDGRKGPEPKMFLPLSAFSLSAERGGELVLKSR